VYKKKTTTAIQKVRKPPKPSSNAVVLASNNLLYPKLILHTYIYILQLLESNQKKEGQANSITNRRNYE